LRTAVRAAKCGEHVFGVLPGRDAELSPVAVDSSETQK
jgi:hypothetical protein